MCRNDSAAAQSNRSPEFQLPSGLPRRSVQVASYLDQHTIEDLRLGLSRRNRRTKSPTGEPKKQRDQLQREYCEQYRWDPCRIAEDSVRRFRWDKPETEIQDQDMYFSTCSFHLCAPPGQARTKAAMKDSCVSRLVLPDRAAVVSSKCPRVVAELQNWTHLVNISNIVHQRNRHRFWRLRHCCAEQYVNMVGKQSDA